jgi:hypothetical protein
LWNLFPLPVGNYEADANSCVLANSRSGVSLSGIHYSYVKLACV